VLWFGESCAGFLSYFAFDADSDFWSNPQRPKPPEPSPIVGGRGVAEEGRLAERKKGEKED